MAVCFGFEAPLFFAWRGFLDASLSTIQSEFFLSELSLAATGAKEMNKTKNAINNTSLSNFIDSFPPGNFGCNVTFEYLFGQSMLIYDFIWIFYKILQHIIIKGSNLIIWFKSESQGEIRKLLVKCVWAAHFGFYPGYVEEFLVPEVLPGWTWPMISSSIIFCSYAIHSMDSSIPAAWWI